MRFHQSTDKQLLDTNGKLKHFVQEIQSYHSSFFANKTGKRRIILTSFNFLGPNFNLKKSSSVAAKRCADLKSALWENLHCHLNIQPPQGGLNTKLNKSSGCANTFAKSKIKPLHEDDNEFDYRCKQNGVVA